MKKAAIRIVIIGSLLLLVLSIPLIVFADTTMTFFDNVVCSVPNTFYPYQANSGKVYYRDTQSDIIMNVQQSTAIKNYDELRTFINSKYSKYEYIEFENDNGIKFFLTMEDSAKNTTTTWHFIAENKLVYFMFVYNTTKAENISTDIIDSIHLVSHEVKYNDGIAQQNGIWYLFYKGKVWDSYTGMYYDKNTGNHWYINKGVVETDYTGILYYDYSDEWLFLNGGRIDFDYAGLWCDPNYGWWLIKNGGINFSYNGLYGDQNYGWWLVQGGAVNFGYNGLWNDAKYGWWLIGGGAVCFDYEGVWNDPNVGSWVISGGRPVEPANQTPVMADGLHDDGNGWHLYLNGEIANWYTGLYCDANVGWWLVDGGRVCFEYSGLWNDPNVGWWLISDGTINWGFTGEFEAFGSVWNIVNGQLVF